MGEETIASIRDELGANELTFGWVQKFADTLKIENFQSELGVTTDFAHALCGLFALFYVCRIVWRSWANGSQLDIYKALKPFVIGMAIMFFSTFVSAVDFVSDTIGKATQEFSDACSDKSKEQFNQVIGFVGNANVVKPSDENNPEGYDNVGKEPQVIRGTQEVAKSEKEEEKEYRSSIKGMLESLLDFLATIAKGITASIWGLIKWLCVLLASIIACCILCMGFIGKCIFYFFGPFLFAMELIPGMEGRIVSWFKKYFTFSLYPCIINIINGVLSLLTVSLVDLMLKSDFTVVCKYQEIEKLGQIHFVIAFIGAFMFMSVPSVASQIMETASNGLGGSGMIPVSFAAGKAGDRIASKIGSGAAAASTGGASKVLEASAQAAKGAGNMSKQMSSDSNFKGGA